VPVVPSPQPATPRPPRRPWAPCIRFSDRSAPRRRPELLPHLDLVTGHLDPVGRLDVTTALLLHDALCALLTPCAQWTLDVSGATVDDHHGLRVVATAYRRANRHTTGG
jgi:hypothetical protein